MTKARNNIGKMDKIARVRQEIERRIKIYHESNHGFSLRCDECEDLLTFLDTLSEEPDKSLEEEIERYLHSLGLGYGGWVDGLGDDDLRNLARHFAEWGAEHLRDSTKMIGKSLEEVAINYSNSWYCSALEGLNETGIGCTGIKDAFIAGWKCRDDQMPMPEDTVLFNKGVAEGRRLEREDMMKDAVEGEVVQIFPEGAASVHYQPGFGIGEMAYFCKADGLNAGDKVHIIVLKIEEEE